MLLKIGQYERNVHLRNHIAAEPQNVRFLDYRKCRFLIITFNPRFQSTLPET